jgi:hypothetical protein
MAVKEYCLLWQQWACLPSSEWAAWTQAIFSVVAIGVAPWLARSAERDRVKQNDKLVSIFSGEVLFALHAMIHLSSIQNWKEWNRQADKLKHALGAYERIDHMILPYASAVSITVIRDSASNIYNKAPITPGVDFGLVQKDVEREWKAGMDAAATIAREAANNHRHFWSRWIHRGFLGMKSNKSKVSSYLFGSPKFPGD